MPYIASRSGSRRRDNTQEAQVERIKVDCIGHMAAADTTPEECGCGVLVIHVPIGVARRIVRAMQDREPEEYEVDGTAVMGRANVHLILNEVEEETKGEARDTAGT